MDETAQSKPTDGLHIMIGASRESAIPRLTAARLQGGIGILSAVNVTETLPQQVGVEFESAHATLGSLGMVGRTRRSRRSQSKPAR